MSAVRRRYASLLRLAASRPEPEPEPVNPRPHEFVAQQLTVINEVTGERRELDPRAWPSYSERRRP